MIMAWLEDLMCCSRDDHSEEEQLQPGLFPSNGDICLYASGLCSDLYDDGKFTGASTFNGKKDKLGSGLPGHQDIPIPVWFHPLNIRMWNGDGPLLRKFSVLKDWATALRSRHAMGVVHGNLTPNSVGVAHGRGILIDEGLTPDRDPPDNDIHGARWAATEFFRLDDSYPRPTQMSDVYSFGCLTLQMLTGSVPYCATKRSEQVVYLKFLGREPIDAKTPSLADHHAVFLRRCWAPKPEDRPTMEAVVDFLTEEVKRLRG